MILEIGSGENGFVNSLYSEQLEDFQFKLMRNHKTAQGMDLPEGYVPQTLYWLYVNGIPVGYGKLRHYLTDKLLEHGGHIGYVIRPSERSKGYGRLLLKELLDKAKEKQISEVLLTCDEDNAASRRIIESNGGRLKDIHDGSCKYWIMT
ncbi:GNAT family N-acetyltransferase [Paenibacillus sp. N3/727]|nr:GNAT family N-acetyltransferase [Paenibacillus sp. N3/727]UNK21327.1 GNAT family N-acetyltransferase [Paenibacillus sp. N3/727]